MATAAEQARFEALYAGSFGPLLGFAIRRCDSAEDAADVVAETFTIAWRRLDAVPRGEEAVLWLYGVARNVLANHRRGEARRRGLALALAREITERYAPGPEETAADETVGRALRTLPDDDRELLALVAWEGLDHGEIATVLGCSRNAVRIRLHRARKRLSRALDAAGAAGMRPAMSGGVP